ncbi:cilia- and flagella-associated protein 74 [Myripristis murdjan]|uniref:cilia- and flagella-associated protein 74 n=1 Tax=Myripristis murdjan TaxID=586833 RepID=UPI0011763CD3|nr:cilia- and flagella-associated protein 74 [Myripristis murdjan]
MVMVVIHDRLSVLRVQERTVERAEETPVLPRRNNEPIHRLSLSNRDWSEMEVPGRQSLSEETGDDDTGGETFREEDPKIPPDLEWEDSDGDLAVAADNGGKRSYAETARMFKLRRNLDQLDCFHRQKEHDVLKAREELKVCRQNIVDLERQRDKLEQEIERQKEEDNSVAVLRLRAQHRRLCEELQREEELEGHINTNLKQQELELCQVEVELGRFCLLRQEVEEEEQVFEALKAQRVVARLQKENNVSQRLQRKIQHVKDKQQAMHKIDESQCQKKIEEAPAGHKKAAKYLKETIKRIHQQEAEKEQQSRELIQRRIQAIESLKSNIAATQESLQAQQHRAKANAQRKEQEERQLRESLQAQGINSIKHMHQQKQIEELQRRKQEFEERQKSKRVEIVAKILQEEQLEKRSKRQEALLFKSAHKDKAPYQGRAREKLLHYMGPTPPTATEERARQQREFSDNSSSSSVTSDTEDLEEIPNQDKKQQILADSLMEAEFSGLWDQNYKKSLDESQAKLLQKEAKQEVSLIPAGKLNMPAKKVVCGKEFKGPPFIGKPDVILFKDFEVGKTYKKKVLLTNMSYTTNYCKLLGVSTQLMDFISINFDPPGSVSPGMACDMQAVFQPMMNQDLEGEVHFASALGPFSVPIRCTIKKCHLEVDSHLIDFGSHVVGQTISRTITLTNRGALATLFSLDTSTCPSPETSQVHMPSQASVNTQQETSGQNTSSCKQESFASKSTGELLSKQESQELSVASQQQLEAVAYADQPSDVEAPVDQSTSDTSSDFSLGEVKDGEIGPFESVQLEIVFTPTIPGEAKLDFLIKFSDSTSRPIPITARGVAVSVPVSLVQPSIDLKICMFDRLYQDTIIVQSSASTALRLTFDVCPEMRKHMEILPKTGFIQAQSSFNAQLKFLPRCSLSETFFDRETGVLEVPVTVQVADQVRPVPLTVHAVVTSSDLQFDRSEVDFGYCSIYQSVKTSVCLTNLSLLPQDFGFIGIPEFIEVQPNDGFGTLLPLETLEMELIFSAKKAKEYHFQLNCKSGINRDFPLSCRGVGVIPPVKLSHSLIQFGPTAIGERSTALLYLINHTAPSAARLFSFVLPEDSEISISPSAGQVLPGEKCLVQVTFRPRLLDKDIREEAVRLLHRAKVLRDQELERHRQMELETKQEVAAEPSKVKKVLQPRLQGKQAVNPKNSKVSVSPKTEGPTTLPGPADIQPGSEEYEEGRMSLLYSFTQRYRQYTVPCFLWDGDPSAENPQAQPTWSPLNTLYLELNCPAIQPPLVATSSNGQNTIDFGQVAVGQKVVKRFTIHNISKESLDLKSSLLDINGPFCLLNALRCIEPGEKHTLLLAFSPALEKKYLETLEVRSPKMTLEVTLHGEGVVPVITASPTGDLLQFGYVLEKESTTQVLTLQNRSAVAVGFRALLTSLCPSRPQSGADSLPLLLRSYTESHIQPVVGTQNYNGLSVFSVMPTEGTIAPGKSQDITVTFQPDHQSVNYSDRLSLELMNKSKVCVMDLKGAACSHNMYVSGGDRLTVPIESLLPPLIPSEQLTESEMLEKPSIPILLTLRGGYSDGAVRPAVRELEVGCIRSMLPVKKSGEFHWDNVASLQQQGFTVEPSRGTVEAGQSCTITISWTAQSGYKVNEVVQVCVPLTLKGDKTEVYSVTLLAWASIPPH